MSVLVVGLLVFLGIHSLRIFVPDLRTGVMEAHGERAWLLPYTAASILGLVLIIWGYGLARLDPALAYSPPASLRHLAILLLLPVFPLLIAAYVPTRLRVAVRHPMLLATILWGIAHLMANGTLADLALFGGFAVWAAIDWISAANRPGNGKIRQPDGWTRDMIAILGGLVIYGLIIGGLHQWLIGVSPL
ncbi:NnrU family protein [Nitratireductor sp.]|uniref:NnrU family protein n=1 Tax=Nitratireductor sp. TaxID=1872084 RepID=UPI0025DC4E79|nr:NnrU family protein [Nitratireductor sp.]